MSDHAAQARALHKHLWQEAIAQTAGQPYAAQRLVILSAVTAMAADAIREANVSVDVFAGEVRGLLAANR